jgi:uncharacterized membrane protein
MISNPWVLVVCLVLLVLSIVELEKRKIFPKLFHYLPVPFWCYFVPMMCGSLGVLPNQSPVYTFITTYLLASCLILLLLNINIPRILRLGPAAIMALAVGTLGIGLGAILSYALFAPFLDPPMWKAVGALAGSWTGGSANMLAIKESLYTPENIFAPAVIVDTVITYLWMGIMIALATFQDRWDTWVRADRTSLEKAVKRLEELTAEESVVSPEHPSPIHAIWLIGSGLLIGILCFRFTRPPDTYFLVTIIGILLSLTPAAKLERYGASHWGSACLYLLLAAMGSKAHLQSILQAPLFIVMGLVWVLIHAGVLATYGYFFRVPMFFLAAGSQANIGGAASAPIVAGVYQPRLAPLGLLLALAANIYGTYFGYWIAKVCFHIRINLGP